MMLGLGLPLPTGNVKPTDAFQMGRKVATRITELEAQLQQHQWQPIESGLPQYGVTVLACYKNSFGNIRRIRAHWIAAKSCESSSESDFGEYDEASDTYYDPEGWYEQIDNAVDYSAMFVSEEVTHWMPLPSPPKPLFGKLVDKHSPDGIDAAIEEEKQARA